MSRATSSSAPRRSIAGTDLSVFPLCLGGNVFGWTADEQESFAILDSYVQAGGNFIDTADQYTAWAPGCVGGESETIIGRWLAKRRNRDSLVLATKVGQGRGVEGLSARAIRIAIDASLRRLQVDHVDLYYAHYDDRTTPLEETLAVLTDLVRLGKVRYIAASKYSADRLRSALKASADMGLARYVALQPEYNLIERAGYEDALLSVCAIQRLSCIPYRGLAHGFLTGKYRDPALEVGSVRQHEAKAYLDTRGRRVLKVLDEIADVHHTAPSAVALSWLAARPTVAAVIASARTVSQLTELLPAADLELGPSEHQRLSCASE